MGKIRLDKYLATYSSLSRKEAKSAIRKGRVKVKNEVVKKEDEKIEESSEVFLDEILIRGEKWVYYMLNKPAGVVSATKDTKERTVVDLVDTGGREIFPMGRLDKDSEGLLILTNNGKMAHRLLSPKFHVEKMYYVEYEGTLSSDAVELFAKGMDIGEKKETKPGKLEILEEGKARITISEGKFHQVKRMMAKVGGTVTYLKRIAMAGISLDTSLLPGEFRLLTQEEIEILEKEGE